MSELEKMLKQIQGQEQEEEPGSIANVLFLAFIAVLVVLYLAFVLLSAAI